MYLNMALDFWIINEAQSIVVDFVSWLHFVKWLQKMLNDVYRSVFKIK